MARLVFLPSFQPDTWLLWTVRGDGSCLRDFRFAPTKEERGFSTTQIESMLCQPGHYWEMGDGTKKHSDVDHWREQISFKNIEAGVSPIGEVADAGTGHRLLSLFVSQVAPLLNPDRLEELRVVINRWLDGFRHVVEKEQFNHWDNTDSTSASDWLTGFGWTSTMLEFCRAGGHLRFIETGRQDLDFAIISAELGFGISSKSNPFQQKKRDYIKPDGLGVRRDQSFLVTEMKGPQDDHDLLTATLQAFCGALALSAKREMCLRLSQNTAVRRPSCSPDFPTDRPSLGLYVIVVQKVGETILVEADHRLESTASLMKAVFPALREVVYFVLSEPQIRSIGKLPIAKVY